MVATDTQKQGEVKRFRLTVYGGGETKLFPGDSIMCLADGNWENVLFHRGGYGMAVRSLGGDLLLTGRVFSADEIRFLAIGLAIASGLGMNEKKSPNVVSGREDVTFTFIEMPAH